jgi:hypothetical protein
MATILKQWMYPSLSLQDLQGIRSLEAILFHKQ